VANVSSGGWSIHGCVDSVAADHWHTTDWADGKCGRTETDAAMAVWHDRFYPGQQYPARCYFDDYVRLAVSVMTKRLLEIRTGRQPHEVFILVLSIVIGCIGAVIPDQVGNAIASVLHGWPIHLYYAGLALFAAVTLLGVFYPKDRGPAGRACGPDRGRSLLRGLRGSRLRLRRRSGAPWGPCCPSDTWWPTGPGSGRSTPISPC
jgi:hypothetical protein